MEQQWKELLQSRFETIRAMLNRLEKEVNKMDGPSAFEVTKPFTYMLTEAILEVMEIQDKRIEDADDLLNNVN